MRTLKLHTTQTKSGKYIHTVVDEDGTVVYKSSPTSRTYVVIAGHGDQATRRWGRLDLVGKDQDSSANIRGHLYDWIAFSDMSIAGALVPSTPETMYIWEARFTFGGWTMSGRATGPSSDCLVQAIKRRGVNHSRAQIIAQKDGLIVRRLNNFTK